MNSTTWEQVRREVRTYRSSLQPVNFPSIKDFCFDDRNNRSYFLAIDPSRMKTSTLFYVDLPPVKNREPKSETESEEVEEKIGSLLNGSADSTDSECHDFPFRFNNSEFYVKGMLLFTRDLKKNFF